MFRQARPSGLFAIFIGVLFLFTPTIVLSAEKKTDAPYVLKSNELPDSSKLKFTNYRSLVERVIKDTTPKDKPYFIKKISTITDVVWGKYRGFWVKGHQGPVEGVVAYLSGDSKNAFLWRWRIREKSGEPWTNYTAFAGDKIYLEAGRPQITVLSVDDNKAVVKIEIFVKDGKKIEKTFTLKK